MARLDEILASHTAQGEDTTDKLLGAFFAVVGKNGDVTHQDSSGRADLPLDAAAYDADTPTMIMSMSKLITATAVLQIVEKGLITLDEDVRPIVPALAKLQILKGFGSDDKPILVDNPNPITLRILLTHTTGLPYDIGDPGLQKWSASINRTSNGLTWNLEGFSTPFIFPPGEGWVYGTSLDWAGQVLEHVTGQKLGAYLEEHIFNPLGMTHTTFWPHERDDLKDRLAAVTFRPVNKNGGEPLITIPSPAPVAHDIESGGAGLYSTPGNYVKFVSALLRGDKILFQKQETFDLFFQPQLNGVQRASLKELVAAAGDGLAPEYPPGLPIDFGFAGMINLEDIPGRRKAGSVMWSGYANAHWWIDRQSGVAGVMFVTIIRDPHGDPIAIKLYKELEEAVYADLEKK